MGKVGGEGRYLGGAAAESVPGKESMFAVFKEHREMQV